MPVSSLVSYTVTVQLLFGAGSLSDRANGGLWWFQDFVGGLEGV